MSEDTKFSSKNFNKEWEETRPQLLSKMMEENPDNPLEVMRAIKQMDEIHYMASELFERSFSLADQVIEMNKYQIAARESHIHQQKKNEKRE